MKTSRIFLFALMGRASIHNQFLQSKNTHVSRSSILTTIILLTSISLAAQEWDDSITITDWDQLWKSGFVQGYEATNQPEASQWFWGINMNHNWNTADYRYNGQIAIKNDHDNPTMYYRSTNSLGTGIWAKVIDSRTSPIGTLTTLNSLRIDGTNLSTRDLTFLNNSGATLVGWNRSGGDGETDFISNRGSGSVGGFEFRDIDNSGNETLLLKIKGDGNVGIGTTNTGTYKLAVNGNIRAKEIKVETGWSDFVFESDYKLPTLEEVETHIKKNGHLKDIPSAEEVAENGVLLGEMDSKLLQKIEELTLYTIAQEKRIKHLEKENETLKSITERITKMEALLKTK